MQAPHHLARSRQVVLDELQSHPGAVYERSNDELRALAAEHGYDVVTLDTALVDLASKGLVQKQRAGRRVRYFVPGAAPPPPERSRADETIRYTVAYNLDEDGYYIASVPVLPGCHSQGRSLGEARNNVREAMRGYIASLRYRGEPVPNEEAVETIEVVA